MSFLNKLFHNDRGLVGVRAPEFPDGLTWFNTSTPIKRADLGGIMLVDFWTYSCVNCLRTLPHVKQWNDTYASFGLTIIGVHTPEFEFEKDTENIVRALQDFGITYPVVADSERVIWNSYANSFWPRKLLVDQSGVIVYDHAGEGAYHETEEAIRTLLTTVNPGAILPAPLEAEETGTGGICYPTTPELYCGYTRGIIGNKGGLVPDTVTTYVDPRTPENNRIFLQGPWESRAESLHYAGTTETYQDYLALMFSASEVNAVMSSADKQPLQVQLLLDDAPLGSELAGKDVIITDRGESYMTISTPRMYNILNSTEHLGGKTLKIMPTTPNFSIYAFTFGGICK